MPCLLLALDAADQTRFVLVSSQGCHLIKVPCVNRRSLPPLGDMAGETLSKRLPLAHWEPPGRLEPCDRVEPCRGSQGTLCLEGERFHARSQTDCRKNLASRFFRSVLLAVLAAASAMRIPIVVSRRAAVAGATAAAVGLAPANAALKPCPSGANNCWSSASTDKTKLSTWTWPSSTSRTAAMADLRAQVLMNPERHACDPALAMPFTPGSVRCAPLRRRCVAGVPAGGPGRRGSRRLDIGRRHAELPAC